MFPAQFRRHRRLTMDRGYPRQRLHLASVTQPDPTLSVGSFLAYGQIHVYGMQQYKKSRINTRRAAAKARVWGRIADVTCPRFRTLLYCSIVEPGLLPCTALRSASEFATSQSRRQPDGPPRFPDREPSRRNFMGLVELLICCANLRGTLGRWVVR